MKIRYSVILVSLLLLLSSRAFAIPKDTIMTPEQYIQKYKDLAVEEMNRTGIPASITLAQGLFESGNGNSFLAKPPYNNHFGIKCKNDWTGRSVKVDDDELQECFRAYDRAEDSYMDHSNFLTCQPRYAGLFKLDPTDYKSWAYGLKAAGYATNPKYPEKLIEKIEKYNLYQYDIGNKRVPLVPENNKPEVKIPLSLKETDNSFTFRNIPAYVVRPGDDYQTIANDHDMMRWEIRKYNDLKMGEVLKPNTIIYLKPKHRKGKQPTREVKEGEGMYYISQDEGIKLRLLYKLNQMKEGEEPAPGAILNLQKKRETPLELLALGTIVPRKGVMLIQEPETGPKPNFENKCLPPKDSDTVSSSKQKTINNNFNEARDSNLTFTPSKHKIKKDTVVKMMHTEPTYPVIDGTDSNGRFHIAQKGETIYGIAKNNGLRYDSLIKWNQVMGHISEGQRIYLLKPKNFMKPTYILDNKQDQPYIKQNTGSTDSSGNFYIVNKGDTLYSISKKLNVTVQQLIDWNGLKDNSISTGQKLKVGM